MNYFRQHPVVSAILANLVLFSCMLVFGFPLFNSGDDVYLMYLLGGGFDQPPTELLHYHYGMHPYIGLLLKNLFNSFPAFNWYAGLLYGLHFLACCVVLTQFIKKNQLVAGVGYYLLFFVMEAFLLLQPSFSNTALVTAIAGSFLLYAGLQDGTKSKRFFLYGCLLLVIAALLRLHMLAPPLIVASPFLLAAITKKKLTQLLLPVAITSVTIVLLLFLQKQYYIQRIPGWEQEEAYRQSIINHYNQPKKRVSDMPAAVRTHANFLERGILWDTTFLTAQKITAATKAMQLKSAASQEDFRLRLFWLLMESRLGILLIVTLFVWKLPARTKKEKYAVLASAGLFLLLCAALILFRKLPGYIVTGGMLQMLAFTGITGSRKEKFPVPIPALLAGASGVLLIWGIVRLHKLSQRNKDQHAFWQCAYKQVSSHKDRLFIVADDKFPIDYFYVWDAPQHYPLPNLLTKDHFLNNNYHNAYKKYGVVAPLHSQNVWLAGSLFVTELEYFEAASKKRINPLPMKEEDCIQVWELR